MKKIMILAIVATVAAFSHAQTAECLKSTRSTTAQRVLTSADLTKSAKTLSMEQNKAAKAKMLSPNANTRQLARNAKLRANGPLLIAQSSASDVIVTPPEGTTTYYKRSGSCYYQDEYGVQTFDAQSGHATIVECDNGEVYIKDPVSKFQQGTWVKGVKNGNTITVATRQPLAYVAELGTSVSLRWGSMSTQGEMIPAPETTKYFTYTINGDKLILEGTNEDLVMGVFWDDDNTAVGFGDFNTVLTADPGYTPASKELVKIPEGLQTDTWYARGMIMSSYDTNLYKNHLAVGFDGADVYVQGIFPGFEQSWIKGTIEDGVATFANLQYIGTYYSYDVWTVGLEFDNYNPVLEDFKMTFDEETKTFTAINDVVANASEDQLSYVAWIKELQIMENEPVLDPVHIPYFNPLSSLELLDEMTIIDANNDGCTWGFTNGEGAGYVNNNWYEGDDWLITRGIKLKADSAYLFAFDVRCAGYDERIEVKLGKAPKAKDMTQYVLEPTIISNTNFKTVENDRIMVPEDGVYYFGIHAISDYDKFAIYLNNVLVDEGLLPYCAAAVENLTLQPAADATKSATLTFDAPSHDLSGNDFAAGTTLTVKIYRNGTIVKEIACAPGDKGITYIDRVPTDAMYTYKVVPYIDTLKGDKAVVTGWVGLDIPAEVTNVKLTDNFTSINATWDPVSTVGANGGVVIPESATYNFCTVEMYEFLGNLFPVVGDPINTEPITGTSFNYEIDTNEGVQRVENYAVTAQNATGENTGTMASFIMGAPYDLVVHESFNGYFSYYWNYSSSSYYSEAYIGRNPSDGDSGNMELAAWSGDPEVVRLMSGKIALGGAANATICLDAKKSGSQVTAVKVLVLCAGKDEPVEVATLDLTKDYALYTIPVSEFKDEPWIRFFIDAYFNGEGSVSLDNIIVSDLMDHNVSITASSPKYVTAGRNASVKAVVNNDGMQAAKGYTVKFYANDQMFAEFAADQTKEIATGKSAEYVATYQTSIFDEAADVTIRAEVVLDGDGKPQDNTAETVTTVLLPEASPVASLDADTTDDTVIISWTMPENTVAEVVEDFESYEGNSIYRDGEYCGEWKAVDVSKGENYGWSSREINWPHTWKVFAFAIIDTEATNLRTVAGLQALSGVNALGFIAEVNAEDGYDQKSDRYVISPELPGIAQTILFNTCIFTNAYGIDTFEVLASSTDTKVESFTKVADFTQQELGWHSLTAELPEGTKYFAIHYTSPCTFGLLVDDIVYSVGGIAPTSYNIYVDQVKEASVAAGTSSYTFNKKVVNAIIRKAAAAGAHTASVTAVYGDRESLPVTINIDEVEGIEDIIADSDEAEIYNIAGVRVSPDKLTKGVYIINGEKKFVK